MFCESIIDVITLTLASVLAWYLYQKLCDLEDTQKETISSIVLLRQEIKSNSIVIHDMHVATNKQLYELNQKTKTPDQKEKTEQC